MEAPAALGCHHIDVWESILDNLFWSIDRLSILLKLCADVLHSVIGVGYWLEEISVMSRDNLESWLDFLLTPVDYFVTVLSFRE